MTLKQTKRRKIIGSVFLLGLVFYMIGLLWLLPAYLKDPINAQLKQNKLQLNYQRLWINPLTLNIHIKNAELKDLSDQEILSAQKMDIDWQLWPLINQNINIDHLFLEQAKVHIALNQNNQLISPVLEPNQSDSSQWQFNPGVVEIVNSSLTLQKQQQQLNINDINLNINLADLINRDTKSSAQKSLLQFETSPEGVFSIEQKADNHTYYWRLNNWPLQQITPWLTGNQSEVELAGHINASGRLQWPPKELPIFEIEETELTVDKLNWPPFSAQHTQLNAREIKLDLNTQHVIVGHLTSPGGELTLHIDPLDISNRLSPGQTSDNQWQTQLQAMTLNNWRMTLQDNRPAFHIDIMQLTIESESKHQNLTAQVKLTAPFNQAISINLNGQVRPLLLQGEVSADSLDLAALNPWLKELSPWQIKQAELSVNSLFCAYSQGAYAQGQWSFPEVTVEAPEQRINTTQTRLHSIGLYLDQKLITFNNIESQAIEIYQLGADDGAQAVDNEATAPQSTDQLWRVAIDDKSENFCQIKTL